MKLSIPALAVSFVVGVVAGAGTALNPVHPLQAAGSPPAYVVYEANVTGPHCSMWMVWTRWATRSHSCSAL
jgi:hypothetical protein